MTELIAALATGLLWLTAGGLAVLCVRRGLGLAAGPALLAAYALFWAAQVLLARLLASLGALTTPAILAVYGAAVPVLAVTAVRWRANSPRSDSHGARRPQPAIARLGRITVALVLASVALFTLIAPVHIWDALAYHLPMIASYVQNGSLDAWPTQDLRQIYRVNAGELQMLNVVLLARSDAWVELPNVAALGVVLVASYELMRLAAPRVSLAWLMVLLVLTAPQIVVGAATEKNDLVFTAVLLASFYWILRALIGPERRLLHVLLAALCAALAGATKVMGLNVVGAVGLLALVLSLRGRFPFRSVVWFGCAAVAGLLVLAGRVYLGNFTRSAVPIGVAPGEVDYNVGLSNIVTAAEFYIYDLTLKRLVTLPAIEHDFLHYGYLFPLVLVAGVATMVVQLRRRSLVAASLTLLTAALFVSVIAVRVPIQWDQRFMMWLVPVLGVLALLRVQTASSERLLTMARIAAILALINSAALMTLEFDRLLPRSARHLADTGTLPRIVDVPNRRYPEMIAGFDRLADATAPHDSILYVGTDDSWMYAAWGPRFTRHVEGVWDGEHAARQVASGRFRFVVIEDAASPAIRDEAARIAAARYEALAAADGRTIYQRPRAGVGAQRAIERDVPLEGTAR